MPEPQSRAVVPFAENPAQLTAYLTKARQQISLALPSHLDPDRIIRLAVSQWSLQKQLRNCSMQSILGAVMVSAQMGLEIGIGGQCYIIPYGTTATCVPGWKGLVGLLNNTGKATVWSGAVYDGDEWEYELGSHPRCTHRPGDDAGDVSKLQYVYACGKVNGSEQPVIEVWSKAKLLKHRDRYNKVGEKHYSHQHLEHYGRKCVVLQVLKYMPSSVTIHNAMAADSAAEMGRVARVQDGIVIDVDADTATIQRGTIGEGGPGQRAPIEEAEESTKAGFLKDLARRAEEGGVTLNQVRKALIAKQLLEPSEHPTSLDEKALADIIDAWDGEDGILDVAKTQKK